jgi:hypothetical protein
LGLGGYHLITEINHSIKPGSYLTSIKARWQTGGESVVDETAQTVQEKNELEETLRSELIDGLVKEQENVFEEINRIDDIIQRNPGVIDPSTEYIQRKTQEQNELRERIIQISKQLEDLGS